VSEATNEASRPSPPSLLLGAAHLAALWALAFVQPMLSLLGANPEFFIARGNTSMQIVVYALSLAFIPPLVGLLIEVVAQRFGDLARWRVHLVLMAAVGSALALELLKWLADFPAGLMIAVAIAIGAAAAFVYDRFRFPRSFMDILTPAPIVILAVFFFFSPTTKVLFPPDDPVAAKVTVGNPAPVVMVIFDEFPLASLIKPDGEVDSSRFPAFAELASTSTWYANATGNSAFTTLAVPAILTGRTPSNDDLPIAADNPESIFTLLGDSYRMNVSEYATRVCPQTLCPKEEVTTPGAGLGDLLSDLQVVSAHLLLPDSIRRSLPDISQSFAAFSDEVEDPEAGVAPEGPEAYGEDPAETAPSPANKGAARALGRVFADESGEEVNEVRRFTRSLKSAGARPALNLTHIIKPHYPWQHIPSGQRYSNLTSEWSGLLPDNGLWDAQGRVVDVALQRHMLEVGFTDTMLRQIINRLKRTGLWERALVVVAADHGTAFRPLVERREAVYANLGEIAPVPLFIKRPGQQEPEIVTRHTCATDILPEIAARLDIEYPWGSDECRDDRVTVVNSPTGEASAPFDTVIDQRDRQVKRIDALFGTDSGWGPIYRFGPTQDVLIGRRASSFEVNRKLGEARALPDQQDALLDYDPEDPVILGLLQRGTVRSLDQGQVLAVSVNGRIQAVGWTFDNRAPRGPGYSILLPPDSLRKGYNRIEIFLVKKGGRELQLLYRGPDDPDASATPTGDKRDQNSQSGAGGGQGGS